MTRASCVPFADGEAMVIVRQSLMDLCEGDHCRAAVLQHMIYWTDNKLAHAKQAATNNRLVDAAGEGDRWPTDTWVYKTRDELSKELFGLFGDNRCATALKWLVERGLLEVRQNPIHKWDRTLQYRVLVDEVRRRLEPINARIRAMEKPSDRWNQTASQRAMDAPRAAIDCPVEGNGMPSERQAIPETTTENTTETTGSGSAPIRIYGADRNSPTPETEEAAPVQARDESTPPPSPSQTADGWTPEKLQRLKTIVVEHYPDAGKLGYRPSKADLDALADLPYERANDFVKAVKNYKRKVAGQETQFTRGLRRFREDGFWEQFIKSQSQARKPSAGAAPVRDINAEADAVSHAVKRQNVYIPAFDTSRLEAS